MPLLLNRGKPDPDQMIDAPTLDLTKGAWSAGAVAVAGALLTWVTGQPDETQQVALMIALVTIPTVGFVTAADLASRAYATAHASKESEADEASEAAPPWRALAMAGLSMHVKASGKGDAIQQLLAMRWNPESEKWEYLLGGDGLEWVDAGKVDQFIKPT